MGKDTSVIEAVLRDARDPLLEAWVTTQLSVRGVRTDLLGEGEVRTDSRRFLEALADAVAQAPSTTDLTGPEWAGVREHLTTLSRARATQGFTPTETATFIFSFKRPLVAELTTRLDGDAEGLVAAMWEATELLDALGLFTSEAYLRSREDVIRRQQDELIELSTPVVKLWDGVVALPLIGTLDSARTQVVMESLLEKIVETDSTIAIIDITGVPTVDTLVAQHLLKAVAAARLMGADCIISGIRPQIAQTIVHLGLDLSEVTTKASLADAVVVALERTGYAITRRRAPAS
ncbi:MAG: rsbT co-antagonist protein RsbR [Baekduia sp.]|jgi:rsbT co-antagonist protein RsbR|nr:rsbT co-antagonist protein RsbR [Baekduia sp.]